MQGRERTAASTRRLGAICAVAGLLALSGGAGSAQAATITVNSTLDSSATACTFRSALTAANNDFASGGCPAGSGADVIRIDADGTVDLASELPQIQTDVSVVGPGRDAATSFEVHRDTGGNYRVLTIGSDIEVSIFGIEITGGNLAGNFFTKGGGVLNAGDLTLTEVEVKDNAVVSNTPDFQVIADGGGIHNDASGTLDVNRSLFDGNTATATATGDDLAVANGAAINSLGPLTIDETTITDNDATATGEAYGAAGGGVHSTGATTIRASTIANNTMTATATVGTPGNALTFGAGIYFDPFVDTPFELDRVTISGNTAMASGAGGGLGVTRSGGLFVGNSSGTVESSTIAGNSGSGDIVDGANVNLNAPGEELSFSNTIVADASGADDCYDGAGGIISDGFNLEEGTSCDFVEAGDQQNTDPVLFPLADNGGPTPTQSTTSANVIDKGRASSEETSDQRGFMRPRRLFDYTAPLGGDGSDIGAYELQTVRGEPPSVDFGDFAPGGSSQVPEEVVIRDEFPTGTLVGTVGLDGPNAADFEIVSDPCSNATLLLDEFCTIELRFAPAGTATGTRSAFLEVPDAEAQTVLEVPLSAAVVNPPPVAKILSIKVRHRKRRAIARFSADEAGTTFRCQLDRRAFAPCTSPRIYRNLRRRKHTLRVIPTDEFGLAGATVSRTFRVKRLRTRRR